VWQQLRPIIPPNEEFEQDFIAYEERDATRARWLLRELELEAGRGIEYVADHLGHKNIQNTRIYAQITNPLRERVFRELEQHPKIVRVS
jgi:integrase